LRLAALALAVPLALAQLPALALAQNLVANPAIVRDLPPPGWLADRRADWLAHRPVYQSACQTADVTREVEFLNRIVGRDENLLVLAGNPPQDNSALAREAQLASQEMDMLRNDIAAADGLVAQLQGLPSCSPAAGSSAAAAAPAAPETSTATSPPTASAAAKPAPDTAQTVTLRFDDKVFGLTPLSIRAFNKTVDAIHDGAEVRLAIDGCDASADFSKDSPCAKRLASVKRLLAEKGITDPKRVLGDHP
jgi:hypothetical protein